MEISRWLEEATRTLKTAGVKSARLDCLLLLELVLQKDRAWLLANGQQILGKGELDSLSALLDRRAKHEPVAYITGRKEFYGRDFAIENSVLVPRPESEAMIQLLKNVAGRSATGTIADIGTGSGALAITAKLECPNYRVIATDIDQKCLDAAGRSAKNLNAKVEFIKSNLLDWLAQKTQKIIAQPLIMLANLPYVPENLAINEAAKHEPQTAIYSGADGLEHYKRFWLQIYNLAESLKPKYVITESLMWQHHALASLARYQAGYIQIESQGLAQLFEQIAS